MIRFNDVLEEKMKVLICDKLDENSLNTIKEAGIDVTYKPGMTPDELIATVPEYNVMVVRSATKATRAVIEAATNLKLIVRAGVGIDNIDVEAAKEKNVKVQNTPGATTNSVVEHTIGLMLALARNIPQGYMSLKEGRWDRKKYAGTELLGKTLGLIGFGRIGQEAAKRAQAFGMDVVAYDPVIPQDSGKELGIPLLSLDDVLAKSDYLSLHVPLIPQTKHMINAETISKMKKGAKVINCARGGTIDEEALANAIKEGHISGAALDVFEKEPPDANNPLLGLEEFICVPHLGASTKEGQARAGAEVAKIVIEFCKQ